MPILMNLSLLSTLTIGLYFIHAAHQHQKRKFSRGYLIWGLMKKVCKNLRPPIGPGEEVCRKLGRAILSQDCLSVNI